MCLSDSVKFVTIIRHTRLSEGSPGHHLRIQSRRKPEDESPHILVENGTEGSGVRRLKGNELRHSPESVLPPKREGNMRKNGKRDALSRRRLMKALRTITRPHIWDYVTRARRKLDENIFLISCERKFYRVSVLYINVLFFR